MNFWGGDSIRFSLQDLNLYPSVLNLTGKTKLPRQFVTCRGSSEPACVIGLYSRRPPSTEEGFIRIQMIRRCQRDGLAICQCIFQVFLPGETCLIRITDKDKVIFS